MREPLGKIIVVDPNVLFAKRLGQALAEHGYEAVHCSEPAYALTMIEWNMPVAIVCSISAGNSSGFEIPSILQADAKTSHIPVIAVGDRGKQSHLEALRAGYLDFVDRRLGAEDIAAHLLSLMVSLQQGFQPTQMLNHGDTTLDGHLSSVDLPSVMQMLEQSRQTGALHINSATADGLIFFDRGEVVHAESGNLAGDDAVMHLAKECHKDRKGIYKFVDGNVPALRTVQASLNTLILKAFCELDLEKNSAQAGVTVDEAADHQHTGEAPAAGGAVIPNAVPGNFPLADSAADDPALLVFDPEPGKDNHHE
jgi:DNA-binding response OmpR family regulator